MIIWIIKKDTSPFVNDQGKEALNFQITVCILYAISGVLSLAIIGLFMFMAVWVVNITFCAMGAVAANRGELYRYPLCLRIIR